MYLKRYLGDARDGQRTPLTISPFTLATDSLTAPGSFISPYAEGGGGTHLAITGLSRGKAKEPGTGFQVSSFKRPTLCFGFD